MPQGKLQDMRKSESKWKQFIANPNMRVSIVGCVRFPVENIHVEWALCSFSIVYSTYCRFISKTLRPEQDGQNVGDGIFKCIFLTADFCNLIQIPPMIVPEGVFDNKLALVGQVMEPSRWQEIARTIRNLILQCHIASQAHYELSTQSRKYKKLKLIKLIASETSNKHQH